MDAASLEGNIQTNRQEIEQRVNDLYPGGIMRMKELQHQLAASQPFALVFVTDFEQELRSSEQSLRDLNKNARQAAIAAVETEILNTMATKAKEQLHALVLETQATVHGRSSQLGYLSTEEAAIWTAQLEGRIRLYEELVSAISITNTTANKPSVEEIFRQFFATSGDPFKNNL
jgi:environmental stress-induced protein Ves